MTINELPADKKIILYDGDCQFCNSAVNYIIARDKKDVFRFVSLQSTLGKHILKHIGIAHKNIDSIILYDRGIAYYYKSVAVLEIAKHFGGVYRILQLFQFVPSKILNYIYDFIAENRYKWFGKKNNCLIPNSHIKSKFLY